MSLGHDIGNPAALGPVAGPMPDGPPAASMLAAPLRLALPGAALLDVGAPFGRLFPWWPGALCGVADAASLPTAERDLLQRFHQRGLGATWPILGLDPAADAALLASAGWIAADRLVCEAAGHPGLRSRWASPDALVLRPAGSARATPEATASDPDTGRIVLLIGGAARVEAWGLLLPGERTGTLFTAIRTAAEALAAAQTGWQPGGHLISPRLATIALLRHVDAPSPPFRMLPDALPHDLPVPITKGVAAEESPSVGGLATGPAARVRLLLGLLPPTPMRLRLRFRGGTPRAVLVDGMRRLAESGGGPDGAVQWEVPIHPAAGRASVFGLALPEGGLTIADLDLLA